MVNGGHVQINGERVKASKPVLPGNELRVHRGQEQFTVIVTALAEKRGSTAMAQALYQETEQSITAREEQKQLRKLHAASSPAPNRRPDKKARRHIIRFVKRDN